MANATLRKVLILVFSSALVFYLFSSLRSSEQLSFGDQSADDAAAQSKPLAVFQAGQAALWYPALNVDPALKVPEHNIHDLGHDRPRTPLFIGFTRSQALVEQAILSYIAAGWPREDIILVDNSGTFDANPQELLSSANPFALNYTLFRNVYGVSILQTPTLLTFAQLMNFYLRMSIAQHWSYFFWTHQDIAVLGDEEPTAGQYQSFYQRVLQVLENVGVTKGGDLFVARNAAKGDWAVKFFAYDWLTLVNVAAWRVIGQWDTFIPYYATDCDAYSRITMHGFTKENVTAGRIYDVSEAMPDLVWKLFEREQDERLNSDRYQRTKAELDLLMSKKWRFKDSVRNSWQDSNVGGQGEPFTYSPEAFQKMWWAAAEHGRTVFKQKWATEECQLERHGKSLNDMFRQPR